jgi:hypothetical protein
MTNLIKPLQDSGLNMLEKRRFKSNYLYILKIVHFIINQSEDDGLFP